MYGPTWLGRIMSALSLCWICATGATPTLVTFSTVDASLLSAWVDAPAGGTPQSLVVFCHGHHETKDVFLVHMQALRAADASGSVLMTASDYRDDQGFPILRGAQDTLAMIQYLRNLYPSLQRILLLGVSMGGGVCGTAASEAGRVGEPSIAALFLLEAVTQLQQTYLEAQTAAALLALIDPTVAQSLAQVVTEIDRDIAAIPEPGGNRAAAFVRRSPAQNGNALQAAGILGGVVVQGVFDGTVPDNQSLTMANTFHAVGIPAVTVQALLGSPGTASGDTLLSDLGLASLLDPFLFFTLVGHGFSGDPSHPVIYQGMCRLQGLLAGNYMIQERLVVVSYPLNAQPCNP